MIILFSEYELPSPSFPLDCYIVYYLVYNLAIIHKLFGEQPCDYNELCDETYLVRSAMVDLVYGLAM